MAQIIGGIATSHIPAIGKAIALGLQDQPYWKPFFDGFNPVQAWLRQEQPDIVIVIYNDHGLNFFLDKIPTFAVGAAAEYRNSDEGWGLPVSLPFPGYPEMSWHIIESLVQDEFDITMCQEMLVDHAFVVPLTLMWPGRTARPVRVIPVAVNTVQFPLPTPARCFKLGAALSRAVESFDENLRVVVVGSGGLSHQLEGKRAGFINRKFDLSCLDRIVGNPAELSRMSVTELVRMAGVQGVELLNWLVMRGALTGSVTEKHRNYHVPISNTAAAVMVLENESVPAV
jgi:protocatechuate 4,5-dioxygenase beta chain